MATSTEDPKARAPTGPCGRVTLVPRPALPAEQARLLRILRSPGHDAWRPCRRAQLLQVLRVLLRGIMGGLAEAQAHGRADLRQRLLRVPLSALIPELELRRRLRVAEAALAEVQALAVQAKRVVRSRTGRTRPAKRDLAPHLLRPFMGAALAEPSEPLQIRVPAELDLRRLHCDETQYRVVWKGPDELFTDGPSEWTIGVGEGYIDLWPDRPSEVWEEWRRRRVGIVAGLVPGQVTLNGYCRLRLARWQGGRARKAGPPVDPPAPAWMARIMPLTSRTLTSLDLLDNLMTLWLAKQAQGRSRPAVEALCRLLDRRVRAAARAFARRRPWLHGRESEVEGTARTVLFELLQNASVAETLGALACPEAPGAPGATATPARLVHEAATVTLPQLASDCITKAREWIQRAEKNHCTWLQAAAATDPDYRLLAGWSTPDVWLYGRTPAEGRDYCLNPDAYDATKGMSLVVFLFGPKGLPAMGRLAKRLERYYAGEARAVRAQVRGTESLDGDVDDLDAAPLHEPHAFPAPSEHDASTLEHSLDEHLSRYQAARAISSGQVAALKDDLLNRAQSGGRGSRARGYLVRDFHAWLVQESHRNL